jgi:hypothetical protein
MGWETASALTLALGSETLTYSGATSASSHVSGPDGDTATNDNYMNAITLVNATDGSGGLASNYQLPTLNVANAPVTITTATLTPTVSNSGYSQVYDGDTTADITPTYSFSGLVSGDTSATFTNTSKVYNDKDVNDANTITVSGLSIAAITGTNSSETTDYVLDATTKTVSAVITPKPITISGITANDKTYDGNVIAVVDTSNARGWISGDDVTVSMSGVFSDKNAGTNKTVTLSDASYGGNDIDNYTITDQTSTTASILKERRNSDYFK